MASFNWNFEELDVGYESDKTITQERYDRQVAFARLHARINTLQRSRSLFFNTPERVLVRTVSSDVLLPRHDSAAVLPLPARAPEYIIPKMDMAIRWSSSSTASEPQFLIVDVLGRTLKLYRVNEYKNNRFEWEELSRNNGLPAFRAFDWSPSRSIVALGQWSGETTVVPLDNGPHLLSLTIKAQRQCNAVAFNTSNLLATGLERVRNDFCLNVYDLDLPRERQLQRTTGAQPGFMDPVRRFATSEAITSIKFFPHHPDLLIAGVKGAIRLYDLRDNSSNPALQYQTLCVHNLAIDPLDDNYFASAAPPRDTTICIWDRRNRIRPSAAQGTATESLSHDAPVCEINNFIERAGQVSIWSLRYSSTESGSLGALSSNGLLRVFKTKKDYIAETALIDQHETADESRDRYVRFLRVDSTHTVAQPRQNTGVSRSKEEADRVIAFDFTNIVTQEDKHCAITLRGNQDTPRGRQDTLRGKQDVGVYEFPGRPAALATSPRATLAVTDPRNREFERQNGTSLRTGLIIKASISKGTISDQLIILQNKTLQDRPIRPNKGQFKALSIEAYSSEPTLYSTSHLDIYDALLLVDVPRRRCLEGYLFDCKENAKIVKEAADLQRMWKWIGDAESGALEGAMTSGPYSLRYLGVQSLWNEDLGRQRSSQSEMTAPPSMTEVIVDLAQTMDANALPLPTTARSHHRRVCLHSIGFGLKGEDVAPAAKALASLKNVTESSLLALMFGEADLAFQVLREATDRSRYETLAMTITFFAGGSLTASQQANIKEVMAGTEDAYAKAILAYVTTGDWTQILDMEALPVKYRIVAAIMALSDKDLTAWLESVTNDAIEKGSVDGILLTGLTTKAISLFQSYVEETGDLQTAVLALSFAAPRLSQDTRFERWKESYRLQLNRWKLWVQRARFDMQSTKLSTDFAGEKVSKPIPPQVTLRCYNCNEGLQRDQSSSTNPLTPAQQVSIFGDTRTSTMCPKCKAHLPRCAVCDHWLGVPDRGFSRGANATGYDAAFDRHLEVCVTCGHMYHRGHANEWFKDHRECPAPDCDCRCDMLD